MISTEYNCKSGGLCNLWTRILYAPDSVPGCLQFPAYPSCQTWRSTAWRTQRGWCIMSLPGPKNMLWWQQTPGVLFRHLTVTPHQMGCVLCHRLHAARISPLPWRPRTSSAPVHPATLSKPRQVKENDNERKSKHRNCKNRIKGKSLQLCIKTAESHRVMGSIFLTWLSVNAKVMS